MKKESLLYDIDVDLLTKIYSVIKSGVVVFGMQEHVKIPTIQSVVPSFHFLRNTWMPTIAGEDRRVKLLVTQQV
jgi:hypothetical protein